MCGNVFGDYRAGSNERPLSHLNAAEYHRAGPDRGTAAHRDASRLPIGGGLERPIRIYGPRKSVVGKDDSRPHKDTVLEYRRSVNECVVLNLAVVADFYAGVDVRASADDAILADDGTFPYLGEMPYARRVGDLGARIDICCVGPHWLTWIVGDEAWSAAGGYR